MKEKIEAIKYTYDIDNDIYNIYILIDNNNINFYIERIDYKNLFYVLSIDLKDKPDNLEEFINNNLYKWVFVATNETEED